MHKAYKLIKELVKYNPLDLSSIKEPKLLEFANQFLPYSVGIEIEASFKFESNNQCERNLLNFLPFSPVLDVDVSIVETSVRVPEGIGGLCTIYKLCEFLKENYYFNPDSGIHYHIDFTKEFLQLPPRKSINKGKIIEIILNSLESWNYTGRFNRKEVNFDGDKEYVWANFRDRYSTLEVRIGEMIFDYETMIKRILHLQNISRLVKKILSDEISVSGRRKVTFK